MPTKQILKVTRSKGQNKQIKIGLSFAFNAEDPRAESFYRAIGLCLKEALTEEEAREFMTRLDLERAKCKEGE